MNCSLLAFLFLTSIGTAIGGHVIGVIAWRNRLPQYSRWQWLWDPTYMYRTRYYHQPAPRLRWLAIGVHCVTVACLLVLIVETMKAQQSGANGLCGFAF